MAEKKSVLPNITLLKEKITYFSIEETGLKKNKRSWPLHKDVQAAGKRHFQVWGSYMEPSPVHHSWLMSSLSYPDCHWFPLPVFFCWIHQASEEMQINFYTTNAVSLKHSTKVVRTTLICPSVYVPKHVPCLLSHLPYLETCKKGQYGGA